MGTQKHTEKAKKEIDEASRLASEKASDAAISKDAKDEKIAELTDLLQHVQADFENYKKRAEKEHQNQLNLGKALLLRRILPVLDTFDQALKQQEADNLDTVGLKRVHTQLISALDAEGLRPIKAEGEKLDPYRHECIQEESSEQCKGTVLEEIQKGYMLNDLLVRHSLVKVSNGKPPEKKQPEKSGQSKTKQGEK